MPHKIVFIGGVHGVGKTHLCTRLAPALDAEHVTASSLIAKHQKHSDNKTVSNIEKNQLILADELSRYKTKRHAILLDGHFCLIKENLRIEDVPLDTFKSISPKVVIVLKNQPASIVARLSKRDSRSFTVEFVETFQGREIKWATVVSNSLNIPIRVIDQNINYELLVEEVATYLQ